MKIWWAIGTVSLAGAMGASAALVNIINPSFESPTVATYNNTPPDGWTSGGGSGGVWNPSSYAPAQLTAADGVQVGYLNGGSIFQVLGSSLQASTRYDLQIAVAGRQDGFNPGTAYAVDLYAGSTLLTSVVPVAPTPSVWTYLTASYTSPDALVAGEALRIVISDSVEQLDFDNVSLNATTLVPEPTTLIAGALLLLPLGVSAFRRMRC